MPAGMVPSSVSTSNNNSTWLIDIGATSHVICSLHMFIRYNRCKIHLTICLMDNKPNEVSYVGTTTVTPSLSLLDLMFVSSFTFNLISGSKLTTHSNFCLIIKFGVCII